MSIRQSSQSEEELRTVEVELLELTSTATTGAISHQTTRACKDKT